MAILLTIVANNDTDVKSLSLGSDRA